MSTQWWKNWISTYGFLAGSVSRPRSVDELSEIIATTPAETEVRAVGGGWSGSDVALPFRTKEGVARACIAARAAAPTVNSTEGGPILGGFGAGVRVPIDRTPIAFEQVTKKARTWVPEAGEWQADAAKIKDSLPTPLNEFPKFTDLTERREARLIDTREMKSSLQARFHDLRVTGAASNPSTLLFHVEAGITMRDLNALLDHQHPRMALRSSSGSPGATVAGVLATATHGAEVRDDLLVDTVRAVHLVDGEGQQWWIEGDVTVADRAALLARYQGLRNERIIQHGQHLSLNIDGSVYQMTAQELLGAACVSLGGMGVLYSVVLEVFPQYGVSQAVRKFDSWVRFLEIIGPGQDLAKRLRVGDPAANRFVYESLMDGDKCDTGVRKASNIYTDLALNPRTRECWVTHREETSHLPYDLLKPEFGPEALTQVSRTIDRGVPPADGWDRDGINAVLRYLGYADPRYGGFVAQPIKLVHTAQSLIRFASWLADRPNPIAAVLAALSAQGEAEQNSWGVGLEERWRIAGNIFTAVLDVIQGVGPDGRGHSTGVSTAVGDIGWPESGLAGAAIEVALSPDVAFSFLHNHLLVGEGDNSALLRQDASLDTLIVGYVSVRICRPTRTLIGMQQFSPHSIMVELVAGRSIAAQSGPGEPEFRSIHQLFQDIEARVLKLNREEGLNALLHWGLRCEGMSANDLLHTPIGRAENGPSKAARFAAARRRLGGDRFDNWATRRLGFSG